MQREDIFNLKFENDSLKIVAADFGEQQKSIVLYHVDEYGRSSEVLINRYDAELINSCFNK